MARSRSRYKGPRLHKTLTNLSERSGLSAEQPKQLQDIALSPRGPRPQHDVKNGRGFKIHLPLHEATQRHRLSANDVQRSEASIAHKGGNAKRPKNRTVLQDAGSFQSQDPQQHREDCPRRRYNEGAESPEETGQHTIRSHKAATPPEQHPRSPRPESCSLPGKEASATRRSPVLPRMGPPQRIIGHSEGNGGRRSNGEPKRSISAPLAIEPPQNTAKPAFDAPVSAVNAGERRIKVKYDQILMSLPVTPLTTPLDIIYTGADQLAESIDPNSKVLFESFKQLGLERPLRRYEHVRDVLNSWDNDAQNTLVIKPSPTGGNGDLLDLQSVPSSQPVNTSVHIHYSQRPGHWDKRWVTLRSDGQMLLAKREGGETANICHISDFDIYIPTARQSAKKIRPPRKICFAVKSQQKSSMFLSTANFVHFFSTSDKTLAASWYKAVQEWRSWYLVNIMGEGEHCAQGSGKVSMKADYQKFLNSGVLKPGSQRRPPEPLSQGMNSVKAPTLAKHNTEHIFPFKDYNSIHNVAGDFVDDMRFRGRIETQTSQSKKLTGSAVTNASSEQGPSPMRAERQGEPETFASTGLLGRTYTQRQKAQSGRPVQPVAVPCINPDNNLHRTLSQRAKPKPLIDLTPQYQEPPQHLKKGRGVVLERIPAGGLVEVANIQETAVPTPPAITWRRPGSRGADGPSVGRPKTVHRHHSSGAPLVPKQTSTSPDKGDMAFTAGFLASSFRGQGGVRMGRGVMTGDTQAGELLLGVGEQPLHAPGRLLERVERRNGDSQPTIQRERKSEITRNMGQDA